MNGWRCFIYIYICLLGLCVCAWSCLTLCHPMDCSPLGPLSMGFSRQKYWSGMPFPTPGDLPNPGVEPRSPVPPALAGRSFTTSAAWEAHVPVCTHTIEYYSSIKKNVIMPVAATWMDLGGIMLSEISRTKTDTVWCHLSVESKKYNKLVNITKKKQTSGYSFHFILLLPVDHIALWRISPAGSW